MNEDLRRMLRGFRRISIILHLIIAFPFVYLYNALILAFVDTLKEIKIEYRRIDLRNSKEARK